MIRALFYIYRFSFVIDFSSKRYIVSTGHRYSWYRKDTAKMPRRKLELASCSGNRKFFPVVGRYFLIIFLSAITLILEGEETLKKLTIPQDNYWKSLYVCMYVKMLIQGYPRHNSGNYEVPVVKKLVKKIIRKDSIDWDLLTESGILFHNLVPDTIKACLPFSFLILGIKLPSAAALVL